MDGVTQDLIWLSGPIKDKEGDSVEFKQLNLTHIFRCGLSSDKKHVEIKMDRKMKAEYSGLHTFSF